MAVRPESDEAAEALKMAARDNDPDLCAKFYGAAKAGNIFVNAVALRIAAENKSYDAFERMLNIAGDGACGPASVYSIGLGQDWDQVNRIAQSDDRIRASVQHYEKQIDKNINEMWALMEALDQSANETQPAEAPTSAISFFSSLKFW